MGTRGDAPRVLAAHPGTARYGTDRVFLEAVAGFVERGLEVRAVLPHAGVLADALIAHDADVMVVPGLRTERGRRARGWTAIVDGWFTGPALVRRVFDDFQPDLLYVSTAVSPQWPKVARKRGVAVLLHLHDLESSATTPGGRLLYAAAVHADRILTVSQHGRAWLLQAYPEREDVVDVVHNPIPGPDQLIAARARLEGAVRIGFIGCLTPQQGADLLIEAAAELVQGGQDVRLEIVGDVAADDAWFRDHLEDLVLSNALVGRVEFRGLLDSVGESLAKVDVLVVPSRTDDAFNTTAAEAVLALRPVIVSDLPGTRETLQQVPAVSYVEPGSATAIAAAVQRLVESWSGVAQLTTTASDELAVRHDPQAFRRRIGALAADLLATHRAARLGTPAAADAGTADPATHTAGADPDPADPAERAPGTDPRDDSDVSGTGPRVR